MSWLCPECGSTNDDSILRCMCGYGLDTPLDEEQGTLPIVGLEGVTPSRVDVELQRNTAMPIHSDKTEGENSPLLDYSDSDVLLQITNPNKGKGTILKKFGIVILSLAIFAGTGLFRFTLSELVILIIVLFVHEAGHLIAMKLFKYSDVKMFFIPFIGAVITGREQTPYASRKALVSIAGPMPGLLIGLFFAILYAGNQQKQYYDIASMFIFINAFNLLPLYPLDGGSFFDSILFSRNYVIEVVFKVITSLLLIALVLLLKAWALILIPFFILVSLKSSYYIYNAAKGLKTELAHQNIETLKLTEELVGKIRTGLDEKAFSGKKTLKNLAALVDATWQRVSNIPPRPLKTLSLLLLYVVSFCFIGVAIVGLTGWEDKGTAHLEKGEYDQAISEFNKALEINPRDANAYFNRGLAYHNKGQYDQAISDYTKALEINPGFAEAYNNRGFTCGLKGQFDQAISDLNKALEINPSFALAYNNRGWAYLAKDQLDQAISDLNKALEINPKFDLPYYNRGMVYAKKKQYDEAISEYTKALEINPRKAEAYISRGFAYHNKGQYDQAISDYTKSLEINPNYALAYNNRGWAYLAKDQFDQAISDLNKALEINPRNAQAHFNRGIAYLHKGQYGNAISDFSKALEMNPKLAEAYINRGAAHEHKGEYDQAISDYNRVLEINPKDAAACNNLAWLLATAKEARFRNGTKAVELALKACELSDGKNPEFLDTLAAAYARVGDYGNAIKWQEKALDSPDISKQNEAQQRLNFYQQHKPWTSD